jgi:hypothetical protein
MSFEELKKQIDINDIQILKNTLNNHDFEAKFYNLNPINNNINILNENYQVFLSNPTEYGMYIKKLFNDGIKLSLIYLELKSYEESYNLILDLYIKIENIPDFILNYDYIIFYIEISKILRKFLKNDIKKYTTLLKKTIYFISEFIDNNIENNSIEEQMFLENTLIDYIYDLCNYYFEHSMVEDFNLIYKSYINYKTIFTNIDFFNYSNWKHIKIDIQKLLIQNNNFEKNKNTFISLLSEIDNFENIEINFEINILYIQILTLLTNFEKNEHEIEKYFNLMKIKLDFIKTHFENSLDFEIINIQYIIHYSNWIYGKTHDVDFIMEEINEFKERTLFIKDKYYNDINDYEIKSFNKFQKFINELNL